VKKTENKKTRSEEKSPLNAALFEGLPTELPDIDSLIDVDAEFDAVAIRDRFATKTFAYAHRRNRIKRTVFDARKISRAVDLLKSLPAPDESIHMIVGQEFAGFDLLPAFLQLAGAKSFEALHLTTLGFSRDNLAQLETMIKAREIPPRKLAILCGDFFRRADSGLWDIGKLLARTHRFTFKSYRNHTKIILAKISGRYYVVESSANLRSCQNIEQFTLSQSKALYDFHAAWIRDCLAIAKP
jgi:hypothetical protein